MKKFQILSCIAAALLLFGCEDDSSSSKNDCTAEQTKCEDNVLYACVDGQFNEGTPCGTDQTCGEDPANPGVMKCLGGETPSDLCTENKTSCDGKKLITCVTGKAKETKECPVKCGADPDNAGSFKCLEDEQPSLCTEDSTSCGENNTLVTCVKGQEPASNPCGDDKTCGADPDNAGAYKCLDNTQVKDCTEDKTECDGNTLITCVIGEKLQTLVCDENQTCGEDADNPGAYKCNDNQPQPTCTDGETKCAENNTLVTCEAGSENSESCGDKTCGADPDNAGAYKCLDNEQIPDCTEDNTKCDESNNLITCVNGQKPAMVACGDKTCGEDADNPGVFKCNDNQPQPSCTEGETKCDDKNNLLTCEGGIAKSTFCGNDKTCGSDPDKEGSFACIENAQIKDCTEDKTECENNSLITCEKDKKPVTVDCGDKICGEDPKAPGTFACLDNTQEKLCDADGTSCDKNDLVTCIKGQKPVSKPCGDDKICGEDPKAPGTFACLDKAPEKLCEADGTSCSGNNLVTCIKGQKPVSKPCGDTLTCGENPKAPGTYACLDKQGKTCEKDYTKCSDNITLITCIKGEKPATSYCTKNQACEEDPQKPGTYACVDKLHPGCTEGATWCEKDNTLVTCTDGKEVSTGCGKKTCAENPEKPGTYACIIITDVCKEDYTKCDDKNNLIICKKGEKEITQSCGDQICGEDPKNPKTYACLDAPKCKDGETKCVDKTLYTCEKGAFDEGKLCTAMCGPTNIKNQYGCLPYTKIVDINNDYKRLVAEKCDGTSAMAAHDYDITGIITGIRADKKGFFIQDTSDSTNAHSGILVDYDVENCPKDKLKIQVGSAYNVKGTGIGHTDCQIMLGYYSMIPMQCQVKVEVSNIDLSVKATTVTLSQIGTTPYGSYNGSLVTVNDVKVGTAINDPKGYQIKDANGTGYIDGYLSVLPSMQGMTLPMSFTGVVHYISKKSVLSPNLKGGIETCVDGDLKCSEDLQSILECQKGKYVVLKTCSKDDKCDPVSKTCQKWNADQCKEGSYACDGTTLLECVKDGNLKWKEKADCSKTSCVAEVGRCVPPIDECAKGTFRCDGKTLYTCKVDEGNGNKWYSDKSCKDVCDPVNGTCVTTGKQTECAEGKTWCDSKGLITCKGGKWSESKPCGKSQFCDPTLNTCVNYNSICIPNDYRCVNNAVQQCKGGTSWESVVGKQCKAPAVCSPVSGDCVESI